MAIPTILNNSLQFFENTGPVLLSLTNINAEAEGADLADIRITVVPDAEGSLEGRFLLNSVETLEFTLQEIENNEVVFEPDGGNVGPSYGIIASVGEGETLEESALDPADVNFIAVNDVPDFQTNQLAIAEGATVTLTEANLFTTDEESTPAELTYDIRSVSNGFFQKVVGDQVTVLPVSDGAFTQADIADESIQIQFVHDGSETAPSYRLRVRDNGLESDPAAPVQSISKTVTVNFQRVNDAPEITVNKIDLTEGDTVPITLDNLAAEDVEEADDTLTFKVTSVTNGQFQLLDAPGGTLATVLADSEELPATYQTFTQAQIAAGLIQFVNEPATDTPPTYTIEVSDTGQLTPDGDPNPDLVETDSKAASVTFQEVNDTPEIVIPEADPTPTDLEEGNQVTVTDADVLVTDEESGAEALTYTVAYANQEPAGQFLRINTVDGTETPTTQFTQAEINAGSDPAAETVIAFDYFDESTAPSFTLTVTDAGGKSVEIPSSNIFNFIVVNDVPVIADNRDPLVVLEGETVPVTKDNLLVTDAETDAANLVYTVTINNADPDQPDGFIIDGESDFESTVTFTQAQVNAGEVKFVQGGSNFAPDLSIEVSDTEVAGVVNTIDVPLSIPFDNFDDPPELETLSLTLTEGDTVPLTPAILSVTDEEAAAADIVYTVQSVTGGQFLRQPTDPTAEPTVATSFTQAEIDAEDVIVFEQDGKNAAPTFELTATDGTTPITITETSGDGVTFTPVNDLPTVTANPFSITEGANDSQVVVPITETVLSTEDEESGPAELTYTVVITDNDAELPDRFEVNGEIVTDAIVTFTQQQVNDGQVNFIHGGSNTIATLDFQVTDTFPAELGGPETVDFPFVPEFTPINDVPVEQANSLTISEGGEVIFDETTLLYTDEETPPENLVYTIESTTNGKFQRRDLDQGTATDIPADGTGTFTQAEINNEEIKFVHDGIEAAPTYSLTLRDTAIAEGGPVNEVTVDSFIPEGGFTNVNDDPTLKANQLTISEGGTVDFSEANLLASDPDNAPGELAVTITNVTGGSFFLAGDPLVEGVPFGLDAVLTFNELTFKDDGDEVKPSYTVTVSDPLGGSTGAQTADVTLIPVNDPPEITVNSFTITEGDRLKLNDPLTGVTNLQAQDDETPAAELTFFITEVSSGLTFLNSSGEAVSSFTQAALEQGEISVQQDGSSVAPTFKIAVEDGEGERTEAIAADINFIPENDAPTVVNSGFTVTEGESITLSQDDLLTTDDPGESGPEELTYTVEITGNDPDQPDGFEINGVLQTTGPITFTQAQVNAEVVKFVQGGSNTLAAFDVSVTDSFPAEFGDPITKPVQLEVTLIPVNDEPELVSNSLVISENGTVIFNQEGSTATLRYTDEETPPEDLVYTIQSTTNGTFQLRDLDQDTATDIPADGTGTFTQADLNAGLIQFEQDGSETAPAYTLQLTDTPVGDDPANIIDIESNIPEGGFTNENDAPTFKANTLTITEDTEVVFTADNLSARDDDNLQSQLRFSISNVVGGEFFLDGELLTADQTFGPVDIAFKDLKFVDDGDELEPSYTVTVTDGDLSTTEAATINFIEDNDAPVITTKSFTITEGDRLTLNDPSADPTVVNVAATDPDSPETDLLFKFTDVVGGAFVKFNEDLTLTTLTETDEVTQAAINRGEISFIHNGDEIEPTFNIAVRDGEGGSDVVAAIIDFIPVNDNVPTVDTAELTVTEGEAQILTAADLLATDPDIGTTPDSLTLTVSDLMGGQFNIVVDEVVTEENVTSFTQQQINDGQVQFVDDGDETQPSFSVTVNDGEFDSATVPVDIVNFINTNDAPVAVPDSGTGFIGEETASFTTASVLVNDRDEDPGDEANLKVTQLQGQAVEDAGTIPLASGAIVSFAGDGTFLYNPNDQFQLKLGETAEDSFTYTVSDGNGGTDSTTVTVTITGVNEPPTAIDDEFAVPDNQATTLNLLSNESNDTDPDEDTLTITALKGTSLAVGESVDLALGTVTLTSNSTIEFTPDEILESLAVGQSTQETFSYTINDGSGGLDQADVTLIVNGTNQAPVANDDTGFTTIEGVPITLFVLENDTDVDATDELLIGGVNTVTELGGTVLNNGEDLTYIPPTSFSTGVTVTDTFEYFVTDNNGAASSLASVTVTVTGFDGPAFF